ncbi:MAG: DUF262 domain-containing protein [Blastocatellia bacterium]
MTGSNIIATSTMSFSELLANGRIFHVPSFQRDYAWREEEWDDLWRDILEAAATGQPHYMGYVLLQSADMKDVVIIDGQQRFATLSILALAVLKHLQELIDKGEEPEKNTERLEILRTSFVGYKQPASLIPTSKLFLNRNLDDFYQSFLLRLRSPGSLEDLKPPERPLWNAFIYFHEAIKNHFGGAISGQALAQFLDETVARRLAFTMIQVKDDFGAYEVFETLNARGVRLSTTDLLKNYLFSVVARISPAELDEAERQWKRINDKLGMEEFTVYLRCYWHSRHPMERKSNLFKLIRRSVQDSDQVFDLLASLEGGAPIYTALGNPRDSRWLSDRDRRRSITELDLFHAPQCYSLLMNAYLRLDPNEFTRLLRICSIVAFRYRVIGNLNANTLEEVCNRAALKIHAGEATTAREIFQELKPVYVADEKFRDDFSWAVVNTRSSRGKRLARYILFSIENQLSNKDYDFEDATATIEHILPENPGSEWMPHFRRQNMEEEVYRLGNLTLLEESKNRECGNAPYEEKLKIYKTSAYRLTAQEANYIEWSSSTLQSRQEKMARWASAVWRVDF